MSSESPKASRAIAELCGKLEQKGLDTKAIADAIGADHATLKNWMRGGAMTQTERFINLLAVSEKHGIPWAHLIKTNAPTPALTHPHLPTRPVSPAPSVKPAPSYSNPAPSVPSKPPQKRAFF